MVPHTNIRLSFRFASKVQIGDDVLIHKDDEFTPEKVIDISRITMQGEYLYISININFFYNKDQ